MPNLLWIHLEYREGARTKKTLLTGRMGHYQHVPAPVGFEVHGAVDGRDGLDRIAELAPDVMTLDVLMPKQDGWEVLTRLRREPNTRHVKGILLTACAQEADLRRGAELGADAYLTKPFDPAELIEAVRRFATGVSPG